MLAIEAALLTITMNQQPAQNNPANHPNHDRQPNHPDQRRVEESIGDR